MNHRHLWVRSNRQWAILRIRATIIKAMRDWLDDQGFLLVDTPIITPAAGEETTTLFEVDYFGENAFLAQTGQLYNEANIMAFGKVYCFGPTFRAEKSKTRRHLIEFWMLEPEIAFCSLEELMDIEEGYGLLYRRRKCWSSASKNLKSSSATSASSRRSPRPSPASVMMTRWCGSRRFTSQIDEPAAKAELAIEWGEDFGSPHETALAGDV